jgi:hypothetical protein
MEKRRNTCRVIAENFCDNSNLKTQIDKEMSSGT